MTVCDMNVRDYDDYCALLRQVHVLHSDNRPDLFRPEPVFPKRADFEAMLCEPDRICLGARENDEMVGMCLFKARRPDGPMVQPTAYGWIEDICVREEMSGRGIGRALYEAAAERARAMGLKRLELMVWAFNEEARGFYEHLGMTERSRIMEMRL